MLYNCIREIYFYTFPDLATFDESRYYQGPSHTTNIFKVFIFYYVEIPIEL